MLEPPPPRHSGYGAVIPRRSRGISSESLSAVSHQPSGIGASPYPRSLRADRCDLSARSEIPRFALPRYSERDDGVVVALVAWVMSASSFRGAAEESLASIPNPAGERRVRTRGTLP
jgi:hypothetical protein